MKKNLDKYGWIVCILAMFLGVQASVPFSICTTECTCDQGKAGKARMHSEAMKRDPGCCPDASTETHPCCDMELDTGSEDASFPIPVRQRMADGQDSIARNFHDRILIVLFPNINKRAVDFNTAPSSPIFIQNLSLLC